MNKHMFRVLGGFGVLAVCAGSADRAPGQPVGESKRVVVLTFEQQNVASSIEDVFGGHVDIGRGIADLVRARLRERGIEIVEGESNAQGSVSGTILAFGKAEGGADLGGVSVGGLRVGVGRRQERAAVVLEARLLDIGTRQVVSVVTGSGESQRGGTNIFARARGVDLATMDLSSDAFKETSIGDATHQAVNQLSEAIANATGALGAVAAPPPAEAPVAAPAAVPAAAPMPAAVPVAAAPVGAFAWVPYQFKGTEHFRYDVRQVDGSDTESGFYVLDLEPAGPGQVRMRVNGQLGDESYSSTVTTGVGPQGMQMGYMQFMTMGPIGIMLFNPMGWMLMQGHQLTVGDGWTSSSRGKTIAFQVERTCQMAGQNGLLVVLREDGEVRQESCVAPDVPLPLSVSLRDEDGVAIDMMLVEYRP